MKCPLCQFEFSDDIACKGCGFTSHCTMIKCPNCQYEFVEKSATVSFFKKLFRKLSAGGPGRGTPTDRQQSRRDDAVSGGGPGTGPAEESEGESWKQR